ncbi:hypothetical protein [Holdemania massiliensis]|uniref:hypothetical protein n=1 Tax=Holdemania massiliensis TaxID=1468449 RepID=UPI001F05CD3B|nr:hypothetical protein [Holdemania massiliensis]MCH1941699.1 hypothetical protein [Holdemania massiliensis]
MNKKRLIFNISLILLLIAVLILNYSFKIPSRHFSSAVLNQWETRFASGGQFGDELTKAIEKAVKQQDLPQAWQLSQYYAFVYTKPEIEKDKLCWTEMDNAATAQKKRYCGRLTP